jgi:hypothetical protein
MMDNDTQRRGTVVRLYTAKDLGRDSPGPRWDWVSRGCLLQGDLLIYRDKRYLAGRDKVEVPLGTRLTVMAIRLGWKRWQDGRIADFVVEIGGRYPQRHELGSTDEREWACGFDGKPSDPWQDSRDVVLTGQGAEYTFCSATSGGRSAVDSLRNAVTRGLAFRPGQLPVIELGWKPMPTRFRRWRFRRRRRSRVAVVHSRSIIRLTS